ncbi:MAG: 3'(2'),5'-bisphosphate nucleotidase CysQ, partial [Rikenellaceae bacterium]
MIEMKFLKFMFDSAIKAALEAGKNIMKTYNAGEQYNVNLKSDNTLIIEADKISHETIRKCLLKTRIPLMSEEGRDILFEERYGWDLYWLIDPIDGTLEFVNKNNEFSICIALMEENKPMMGIIVAPAFKQLYYAIRGTGAYKIENIDFSADAHHDIDKLLESAVRIECNKELPKEELIILTTLSNPNIETERMVADLSKRFPKVDRRRYGSALKFCRMAEGVAHLYFRT